MAISRKGRAQLFQSPILIRDPEQTNHTQNSLTGGKEELGLQILLLPTYIYSELDQLFIKRHTPKCLK